MSRSRQTSFHIGITRELRFRVQRRREQVPFGSVGGACPELLNVHRLSYKNFKVALPSTFYVESFEAYQALLTIEW